MTAVLLVDYGVGNLRSVRRALEECGADVRQSGDPADVMDASRLVLPGVGAFGDCMHELRVRGLVDVLRAYGEDGRPFLGICVGMQMLFDGSEEFGDHKGLGLLPGMVRRIPSATTDGATHKIPHIGWNHLHVRADTDGTILEGHPADATVYFVHSFTADPADPRDRLADALYGGRVISAAVRRGALHGTQFHPEKSGPAGLAILRRFLELDGER